VLTGVAGVIVGVVTGAVVGIVTGVVAGVMTGVVAGVMTGVVAGVAAGVALAEFEESIGAVAVGDGPSVVSTSVWTDTVLPLEFTSTSFKIDTV
jgi:hypothetical protein